MSNSQYDIAKSFCIVYEGMHPEAEKEYIEKAENRGGGLTEHQFAAIDAAYNALPFSINSEYAVPLHLKKHSQDGFGFDLTTYNVFRYAVSQYPVQLEKESPFAGIAKIINGFDEIEVNGKPVDIYSKEITSACILGVSAGTNGYQGGDTGHGSRTYIKLEDLAGVDMTVNTQETGCGTKSVTMEFGGDCELESILEAFDFITYTLRGQIDEELRKKKAREEGNHDGSQQRSN